VIITLVVAAAENEVIGRGGALPWHIPADLRHFQKLTTGHVVVMGRRTHESILDRLGHPLGRRVSVVVSRSAGIVPSEAPHPEEPSEQSPAPLTEDVVWVSSVEEALEQGRGRSERLGVEELFVIGGASVYEATLPFADRIVLTRVHRDVEGDVRMPVNWLDGFTEVARDVMTDEPSGLASSIITYERSPA
jgi:dihydrofolate reductase